MPNRRDLLGRLGFEMLKNEDKPSWRALGKAWPHHETSRFVHAGGMDWHVQTMGDKALPTALLVHGSGASTHSWRDVMPRLARRFHVIAMDLPGHAFSETPAVYRPTLPRVSQLLAELVGVLEVKVELAVGHSAGAAILAKTMLDRRLAPAGFVSINGAFKPFPGAAGHVFPAIAKLLFVNPLTPRVFAFSGRERSRVARLIDGTGSKLNEEGLDYYHTLMMSPGHISGVLGMMANWDLVPLVARLDQLDVPTLLMTSSKDTTIQPSVSKDLVDVLPNARYLEIADYGHLVHEEDPECVTDHVMAFADQVGLP